MNQERYAQIIKFIIYLSNRTRPNITYAISRLNRYINNHSRIHWIALKHFLDVLKVSFHIILNLQAIRLY